MAFKSNAHTHSTWCDGKNSLHEMATQAVKLGFTDLGFTSHSYAPFDLGCLGVKDEQAYQRALAETAKEFAGRLTISRALEWDYFSPDPRAGYDYTIGSVHYFKPRAGIYYSVDESPEKLAETLATVFHGDVQAMVTEYFDLVVAHLTKNHSKIVGHFDLITKFNDQLHYLDEESSWYQSVSLKALKEVVAVIAEYNGLVEVNTGGMSRGWTKKPYPAEFLLNYLLEAQVPIIITSDSHSIATLDYRFNETAQYLKQLGFNYCYQLENGTFVAKKL